MRKFLMGISFVITLLFFVGCSNQEKKIDGAFLLGNFAAEWKEGEFHLVVPIEWTGETPVTIKSIDFIKDDGTKVTFEKDGIEFDVYGADPMKTSGIYTEPNLGIVTSINGLEIQAEGKIVFLLSLKDVDKDSKRRVRIKFESNGEEFEKIVGWKTLEQLTTYQN